MDVIEFELKRYEAMQNDLENRKSSYENVSSTAKSKDQSKSADDLDALMNEEKPREVNLI